MDLSRISDDSLLRYQMTRDGANSSWLTSDALRSRYDRA
jgi:hypothetical protein